MITPLAVTLAITLLNCPVVTVVKFPDPSDMFTLTMLYCARFATTHCKACSIAANEPEPLSPSTFSAMMFAPGATPG